METAVASKSTKYEPPAPAPLPDDYEEFLASRTEREKALLELARNKLASSFVVQWSHMYVNWKKSKA